MFVYSAVGGVIPMRRMRSLSSSMTTSTRRRSGAISIFETVPTRAPRILTGAPVSRPWTDSSK